MNKKGVKYLRFSSEEQSHFSIERQDIITSSWMEHTQVETVDCFVDKGFSATNFDRPDFIKLNAFIEKNYRNIDYLVVSDLTRFSREAGDALNIAKKIQKTYGIKIVSAGRSTVYDCTDHNSFFMMGLEFLLGNTENLKRINDINSGIYAAKAIKQRYIGPRAPFGYKKEGRGQNTLLVPIPEEAKVIRFIFQSYLRGVPISVIEADARDMGLKGTRHCLIERILACPVYSSQQHVKSYKDQPGGLYPLKDQEPIIDLVNWTRVQDKLKKRPQVHIILHDDLPLRGVLYCHCGKLLTGAPSRGKSGKHWYYYKCNAASKHNNVSAIQAHKQLMEAFQYMSLTTKMIKSIILKSEHLLETRTKDKESQISKKQHELEKLEADMQSLERKWIAEQVSFETYNRWHNDLTKQRNYVRAQIDQLNKRTSDTHTLLVENIWRLTDMENVYLSCPTTAKKQELIRLVFDNSLYYQDRIYRTPYLIPELAHNALIMKEKHLLILNKKGDSLSKIPSSGAEGSRTPVQTSPPKAFYMLIPALIVGKQPEPDTPIVSLAEWS
jgi:site-specific DNA recombinase